ncbi:amidohydrolase [Caulobacter segnis]|uniref:amidohydrolase n=1 Tax=Caulobacter segnis TaxID=88688 RepID=UPI0024101C4A|nr:amidohydrolase [Caulobacter segnis]MDG2520090.1 amidohydrolase [Caulobacter segnis]
MIKRALPGALAALLMTTTAASAWAASLPALKKEAVAKVDSKAKLAQQMNDSIFSFGELGFQEIETSKYITGVLEKNGFTIQRGTSGLPTGWVATWTNKTGGPVIALGSDIDGIPKSSQTPGLPYRKPLVDGAPGHGEGHNSGQAVNVVAALAVKELMEREGIAGTLMLWPGVAEELVASKAYMVRDGVFKNVDAVIFTHVGDNLATTWGKASGTGLVSIQYTFKGETAHSAGKPWQGKSALDAVSLMNAGWEFRREHIRPEQRSHYVITDGGDQPNVVPEKATVWYYFREQDFKKIADLKAMGDKIADGAAMMTDTTVTQRVVGYAAPRHFNKPMAEAAYANIQAVGLPKWDANDQAFAKAVQANVGADKTAGLDTELKKLEPPVEEPKSGGSDDIGDVAWAVPTITVNYPSNIPGLPGHNWRNGISMATPIAHKGVVAGSKVVAMTTLDLLMRPDLRAAAKDYFTNVQTKNEKYAPLIGDAKPPIELNTGIMAQYREAMKPFYYDETKDQTYLEQLGVKWPTLDKGPAK